MSRCCHLHILNRGRQKLSNVTKVTQNAVFFFFMSYKEDKHVKKKKHISHKEERLNSPAEIRERLFWGDGLICCLEQHVIFSWGDKIGHLLKEITSNLYDKLRVCVEREGKG